VRSLHAPLQQKASARSSGNLFHLVQGGIPTWELGVRIRVQSKTSLSIFQGPFLWYAGKASSMAADALPKTGTSHKNTMNLFEQQQYLETRSFQYARVHYDHDVDLLYEPFILQKDMAREQCKRRRQARCRTLLSVGQILLHPSRILIKSID
jgi:hypothetical protein